MSALVMATAIASTSLAWAPGAARAATPPTEISGLDPAESQAYSEATHLFRQKRWEDAAIVLRGIIRRNPETLSRAPNLVMDLVKALAYSGRREDALSLLDQALSHEPKAARKGAWIARIRLVSRLFLTNTAFQVYQDGVNLLDAGKTRAAREKFERALSSEPDNVEILLRLGQCLVTAGDDDSAAERLKLASKLNPYEPEISLWLGRALHRRGELQEALIALRSAAENLSGSELAPLWYAEALASAGKRQQALQWLESSTAKDPMNLSLLIASARTKSEDAAQDKDERSDELLWSARKDLQLAMSRLNQITAPAPSPDASLDDSSEGDPQVVPSANTLPSAQRVSELGYEPHRSVAELKQEILTLQKKIDQALNAGQSA